MKICSIDDCGKEVKSRGMCSAHYEHARRTGALPGLGGRECSVADCKRPLYAKGFCGMHYKADLAHGDPLGGGRAYASPEEAFEARTEWQGDCLIWIGSQDTEGYGLIRVNRKMEKAHRYAWERVNGAIPEDRMIDHVCYTPACVNLNHLRLATRSENRRNQSGLSKNNTSGYRNVSWDEDAQKWLVQLGYEGKSIKVGRFADKKDAADAAQDARGNWYQEFAGRG